jgi:hypothetical protein
MSMFTTAIVVLKLKLSFSRFDMTQIQIYFAGPL